MKVSSIVSPSRSIGLPKKLQRYQLVFACLVIALCFALGNDYYRAKALVLKHKDLLRGSGRAANYLDAVKRQTFNDIYRADLKRRYLIDPRAAKQKPLTAALMSGTDACNNINSAISALPYADNTGDTTGLADDYDLSGDPSVCPSCTCPTCNATSGGFPDRGITYTGSGTGPDAAYRIKYKTPGGNLLITLDPLDTNPNGDDMALILYGPVCSSSPATVIAIADNTADGNTPASPDNTEFITVSNLPAGFYNIVVDGYTYAGEPVATAGLYTLNVTCATPGCLQPSSQQSRFARDQ